MSCFIPLVDHHADELPQYFTNPFDYRPHPLCIEAKNAIKKLLPDPGTMAKGKMYGVLVVKNNDNQLGFLVSYSGNEKETNTSIPFVPQVFDITNPDGFFRQEEKALTRLNDEINALLQSKTLLMLKHELAEKEKKVKIEIASIKTQIKQSKEKRELLRDTTNDTSVLAQLIKESQSEKSRFNALKKKWKLEIKSIEDKLEHFNNHISELKKRRKTKSAQLQQRLFSSYIFNNAEGEHASALEIFNKHDLKIPPAGAGDCAAPKLLQYAYLSQLKPLAMAEFWWGPSPITIIRKQDYFYPACKSKCEPILGFMLKGLSLPSPVEKLNSESITVLFEDDMIAVINKPAGLLSVPGKEENNSVYQQAKELFPNANGPLIVHRLDMSTSGIMLIAKTKMAHSILQKQFLKQTIKKQYVALLDGIVNENEGVIDLPLRVDLDDRPKQMVCNDYGKRAISRWEVIARNKNFTRIHFFPHSGRTHQLRVHAAHPLGLNTPIVGDPLYGIKKDRLHLHAERIEFIHPESNQTLVFECPATF
ncbi:RluA family pseudouridine synthase [Carboxylicivirga marina]|uniref:RluA family pseudouridine synthase n=1 Tax=Carboxylicivirga marina TaxID=2800988 RepID=UPI00259847FE|nr:pseudouridine synthase [uncultured Carboxylicivirga sp.]